MEAEIISVGTELTFGLTLDTNAGWLSRRLAAIGLTVKCHITVPDDVAPIKEVITRSAGRAEVVLVSGGLGPTPDDMTRQGLADALGRPLVSDPESLHQIRSYFQKLHRRMPLTNERQALLPEGATALENTCGTAPGIRAESGQSVIYVLPGVPKEMVVMYEHSVEPELAARAGGEVMVSRTINCFGAGEANIAGQIEDLMAAGRHPLVGITADEAVIRVRIIARGTDPDAAQTLAETDVREVRNRLGKLVFGQGEQTLQESVARLLSKGTTTVATAESCTGGLLAKWLTDVPGSSAYFVGGLVAYANQTKIAQLGVPAELIDRNGAVSQEVAAAMAQGCRRTIGTDFALSTTGIAGPAGGSAEKPVGLVYVGMADEHKCTVRQCLLGGHLDRESIRDRSCKVALNMLRLRLMELQGTD